VDRHAYHNCADIKRVGVDCGMMLVRYVILDSSRPSIAPLYA